MTQTNAERTLHEYYAMMYKIDPCELHQPGNAVRLSEGLAGKNTVYFTRPSEKACISVGPDVAKQLGMDFLSSCSLDELAARCDGWELEERYPWLIYESDLPPGYTHPDGYEIRRVDPEEKDVIREFLALSSEQDIDDAEIDVDDPDEEIRMAYYRSVPVAYAGYRVFTTGVADTGILVHPDHRGRGLACSLVGEVTGACIERGRVPMWRTWDGNQASYHVALHNGYTLKWKSDAYKWSRLKD